MNRLKTFLLMVLLTAIFMLVGQLIAGREGLIVAFILALAMNLFSYWYSDRIAISMTRSRPLSEHEAPEVYRALRELTHNANMPMPRVYLMPTDQPNAFATGRNPENAVIAVTAGLLRMLDYEELKGVLGHELAHIRNRDILVGSIAAALAGALMFVARLGMWGAAFGGGGRRNEGGAGLALFRLLALVLAPIAALLIQMAISRTREYGADATSARLTGNPQGLASALAKMESYARRRPLNELNQATAHMFIINPFSAEDLAALFSTHPPIRERIARLQRMRVERIR
ncbi:MAG: zinc metalloprotease HtpX [Firmicutes bacterium]|mgnify:CR=1 FL=1|jgi:heat shock protein HtpX|nr:zinc metalloprotease HtpX [Bacillota bacterium]HPU01462.1 zinc metalloprotease HtpX [Bacillota bacterium]